MFSRPLIIFVTLIWTTSNIFTSFLKCTAQNWTPAEALTVLSGAEGLFHMSHLVYTSHCDVSLYTTSEHFWLVFDLWFTQTPDELLKNGYHPVFLVFPPTPNLYLCGWFFLTRVTTGFHPVFFSDHFVSLLGSFWFFFLPFWPPPNCKFNVLSSLLKASQSWKYWAHLDPGQHMTGYVPHWPWTVATVWNCYSSDFACNL